MAAVNSVSGARLGLGALRPRAVLMCGAVGGEGGVALQLRGAGEVAVSCQDPALLADLLATLHAAGSGETATATFDLLDSSPCQEMALSPQLASDAFLTDTSDSLGQSEQDQGTESGSSSRFVSRRLRPKAASPSRQGPQQCQVCNKIFGNASALAKHKLTHSDERKYGCPVCAKAFKRQDHLNGHMLTHRNKKPFECRADGCGKSYCDARSLRRHAENHHGAPATGNASSPQGGSCIQFAGGGGGGGSGASAGGTTSGSSGGSTGGSSGGATSGSSGGTTGANTGGSATGSSGSNGGGGGSKDTGASSPVSAKGSSPKGTSPLPLNKSKTSSETSPSTHRPSQPSSSRSSSSHSTSKSSSSSHSKQSAARSSGASSSSRPSSQSGSSQARPQGATKPPPAVKDAEVSSPPKPQRAFALQRPPRTWNMQAQQSQQRPPSLARGPLAAPARPPPEPRPVECNLCHRKFKNVPALNGHMRLHGGYFKKEAESKKSEKKEASGPPLQTASVSVRALIEEKIISRRAAPVIVTSSGESQSPTTPTSAPTAVTGSSGGGRSSFVAPAPPPPAAAPGTPGPPAPPPDFLSPRAQLQQVQQQPKDATLIELLKRGSKVSVKRSASDPGHQSPGPVLSFQPAEFTLTSMSFQQDEGGYFSPSLQDDVYHVQDPAILLQQSSSDSLQFTSASEQLDDLASLEDYATVTASLQRSPIQYPVNQQLQAVLNSPLPESLADFSTYHSTVAESNANSKDVLGFQKEYIMYANSPHVGLSAPSPLPSPLKYHDSPSFTYPTPPASHEAQSPSISQGTMQNLPILSPTTGIHSTDNYNDPALSHSTDADEVRNTRSPLSAAFFTTTMSSAEEVEEALEEVLPGESIVHGDALDMYGLSNPSPPPQSPMCVTPLPSPLSNQQGNTILSPCTQTFVPSGNITFPRQVLHTLQSQMMPNSDDPLLSSSPKDFGSKKKFDFGGYQSYKIISHGPIDLNNPNLTGILVEANGEYKLIQAASNQLPVSWLTGATHQIISKESIIPVQPHKVGVIKSPQIIAHHSIEPLENSSNEVSSTHKIEVDSMKQETFSDASQGLENIFKTEGSESPQQSSRKRPRSETPGFCFQNLHQSRLRSCTDDFFTPPPILDPARIGPGLYNEANPNSGQIPCSHQVLDGMNMNDSGERKVPRINVGSQFQAMIPEVSAEEMKFDRDPSYEHLLWDPGINDNLDDNEIRMFMELAMCAAMPVGGHTREHALHVLGQCGGDTHAATLRLMGAEGSGTSSSSSSSGGSGERWTPGEVEAFLAALREHDKDFFRIGKQVATKTSKQCVQFYYFWKKVTKDYKSLYLRSWSPDTNKGWWRWSGLGARPPSTPPGTPATPNTPNTDSGDEFPCKLCGKVFNKVKSRSAHMKSHRPPDADSKRPRVDRERSDKLSALDDKHRASPTDNHSKPSAVTGQTCSNPPPACP